MTWRRLPSRPLNLPAAPLLSKADADIIFRADITLREWEALTEVQRANLRWRMGA